MLATRGSSPGLVGNLINSMGRTKCLHAGSDLLTMSLDSWYSRSSRSVWLETRHTTGRPSLCTVVAVAWVWAVVTLASLPEDLCRSAFVGRCESGECEAEGEPRALRPRDGGRSCACEAF